MMETLIQQLNEKLKKENEENLEDVTTYLNENSIVFPPVDKNEDNSNEMVNKLPSIALNKPPKPEINLKSSENQFKPKNFDKNKACIKDEKINPATDSNYEEMFLKFANTNGKKIKSQNFLGKKRKILSNDYEIEDFLGEDLMAENYSSNHDGIPLSTFKKVLEILNKFNKKKKKHHVKQQKKPVIIEDKVKSLTDRIKNLSFKNQRLIANEFFDGGNIYSDHLEFTLDNLKKKVLYKIEKRVKEIENEERYINELKAGINKENDSAAKEENSTNENDIKKCLEEEDPDISESISGSDDESESSQEI